MVEPQRYVHKPTVVEAMRWDGSIESAAEILAWVEGNGGTGQYHGTVTGTPHIAIDVTDGGAAAMTEGMWLVHGVGGLWYPIEDFVHAESYSRAGACWEDGPRTDEGPGGGSTCLLDEGHDGPHEFTPDREIVAKFA